MTTSAVELHPVPEAQGKLGGIGRTMLYRLIADGELATVHIGRRTFIASDEIEAFIERRRAAESSAV